MDPRDYENNPESSPLAAFLLIIALVVIATGIVGAAVKFGGF